MEADGNKDMLITVGKVQEIAETKSEKNSEVNSDTVKEICRRIEYEYPFEALRNIQSKAAVSSMIKKEEAESFDFTYLPGFLNNTGLTPTERGTAVHKIMQYMDFSAIKEDFEGEINRLREWEYISENEAQVDTGHIKAFVNSDIFKRMCASKDLRREMKFLTFMPAAAVEENLPQHLRDENIVVQGAVDCMFVEDGGLVIVDFKTDRVKDEKRLVDSYAEQLNIYAVACEKIMGLPVKVNIIYSLVLDRCIVV